MTLLTEPTPELVSTPIPDDVFDVADNATNDTLPITLACEVCGTPLSYAGKGRKPRFCAEHKPGRGTATRASRGGWKDAGIVEAALTQSIEMIAGGLLFMPDGSPLNRDGETLYSHGPRVAHELVVLAENDPRLRLVLTRLAAPGKYSPLVIAVGGLVLGLAGNHGLLPPILAGAISDVTRGGESAK